MDLSIVVVTWNASRFVEECFGSILEEARGLSAEVIAVDNASTDGTADMIAERFPEVKLIRSPANLGFPKGNVVAIEASRPGRYVCLVNPDVRVLPGCFRRLLEYIEKNPTIGVLGPKILNPDSSVQQSCFRAPSVWISWCGALALDRTVLRRLPLFGGLSMADFAHDRTRDVEALNGCFLLIRREAMQQVGLIDERYFMYGDDLDWCLRFRKGGWRVVFYPEAEAIHHGGGTTAQAPVYFYVEMRRANLQYFRKHHSWLGVVGYQIAVWIHETVRTAGYSALYCFSPSRRPDAAFKIVRSLACIRWLSGDRSVVSSPERIPVIPE